MATAHHDPKVLWRVHRALCGGVSQVSRAQLPEELDQCSPGVQATWYGEACFHTHVLQARDANATPDDLVDVVPIPPDVAPEAAENQRLIAHGQYWALFGYHG